MGLESLVKQFSDVFLRVALSASLAFIPAYSGCKDKDDDKPVATTPSSPTVIQVTSKPLAETVQDELYYYDVESKHSQNQSVSYSLKSFPSGMSIDSKTGEIIWTPTTSQGGSHDVIVEISDTNNVVLHNYKIKVATLSSRAIKTINNSVTDSVEVVNLLSPLYETRIDLPAGATASNASVTISQVANPPELSPDDILVGSMAGFEVSSGRILNSDATITIPYDPSKIPPNLSESDIEIIHFINGSWRPTKTTVDTVNNKASVKTRTLSLFATILSKYSSKIYQTPQGNFSITYWDDPNSKDVIPLNYVPTNEISYNSLSPIYVQDVGYLLEKAYDVIVNQLKYKSPSKPIDVRIKDADDTGSYVAGNIFSSQLVINKDASEIEFWLKGSDKIADRLRIITAHEFFHMVQHEYNTMMSAGLYGIPLFPRNDFLYEGSARWMEDIVWDDIKGDNGKNFYVNAVNSSQTRRSLDSYSSNYEYETVAFFRFLSTAFGNDIIREIWEEVDSYTAFGNSTAIEAIDKVLHKKNVFNSPVTLADTYFEYLIDFGYFRTDDPERSQWGLNRNTVDSLVKIGQSPYKGGSSADKLELIVSPIDHLSGLVFVVHSPNDQGELKLEFDWYNNGKGDRSDIWDGIIYEATSRNSNLPIAGEIIPNSSIIFDAKTTNLSIPLINQDNVVVISLANVSLDQSKNNLLPSIKAYLQHPTGGGQTGTQKTWQLVPSGTTEDLTDIWGVGNIAYAVGDKGTILFYDGSSWQPQNSGTPNSFNGVRGTSQNNVYAVSLQGMSHYDGTSWSNVNLPTSIFPSSTLYDLWIDSLTQKIYLTGFDYLISSYHNGNWNIEWAGPSGSKIHHSTIFGTSASSIYIGHEDNTGIYISKYDDNSNSWTYNPWLLSNFSIGDIWATPSKTYVAFYNNGVMPGTNIVSKYNGILLDFNGTSSKVELNKEFVGIWGKSPSDIYAVGFGIVYHYDGSVWSPITNPAISGGSWSSVGGDNELFIVGDGGKILQLK